MSGYEELCAAFFENEPSIVAVDTMLRELPMKIKEALSICLDITSDKTVALMQPPRHYVDLYAPVITITGEKGWGLCEKDNSIISSGDEEFHFYIGIYLEKRKNILNGFIIYIMFVVTDFDDHSVELTIDKCDEKIKIGNTLDPSDYLRAAQQAIDAILSNVKSPLKKNRIGFVRRV